MDPLTIAFIRLLADSQVSAAMVAAALILANNPE